MDVRHTTVSGLEEDSMGFWAKARTQEVPALSRISTTTAT